ncbi:glycolate oxidase FAD binding subunit [Methylomarinovum tepidoasis]|uniref:Glycolate oxidase FAD binding subunit n=1 Tax=Methylomarinovum tepidoasis TaxID=2840183 RepID=A0AAU9D2S5_9GAMM|nr:glycolate oxidase subunit GlcE [Methylomarinovum sp. IN45]BCX89289.1 glycolate oxidase FAD binding subunit [Methylomarinovum sp. IN45]
MDLTEALQEQVSTSCRRGTSLRIVGGGSKAFYGRAVEGEVLALGEHRGVVAYQPSELVVTVRGGTPLAELEQVLAAEGQMLGFEPPHFCPATVGGAVAAGLSGPRRPFAGAVRDFVLGVRLLTGRGEVLSFGGQVMKNVAGFDLARVLAGSLGTLGVILEVSLKVLPKPPLEVTLRRRLPPQQALGAMAELMGRDLPLSGLAYDEPFLYLRLSGLPEVIEETAADLGAEYLPDNRFWLDLREQRLAFFTAGEESLWRLAWPPAAPNPDLPGRWLLDWGGAQRWLRTTAEPDAIFQAAAQAGGHATWFRGHGPADPVFQPLPPQLFKLHKALKEAFDPKRILNPGRMYEDL